MTRIFIFIIMLFTPIELSAKSITIRGGEHTDFTRLSFEIEEDAEWRVREDQGNQDKKAILLSFMKKPIEVDTSVVFDRISRDRVKNIEWTPLGEVEIILNCNCLFRTFLHGKALLVVDILENKPGDTQPDSPQNIKEPSLKEVVNDLHDKLTYLHIGQSNQIGPRTKSSFSSFDPNEHSLPVLYDRSHNTREITDHFMRAIPFELVEHILQGTLTSTGNSLRSNHEVENVLITQEVTGARTIDPTKLDSSRFSLVLQGNLSQTERSDLVVEFSGCYPEGLVTMTSWIELKDDPFTAYSRLRGQIFGEFDKLDEQVVLRYVKAAISLGFGYEARDALKAIGGSKHPELKSLSYLVDGLNDPEGYFSDQLGCSNESSLWGLIENNEIRRGNTPNVRSILSSLERLPKTIRLEIGIKLIEAANFHGLVDLSRSISDRLERTYGRNSTDLMTADITTQVSLGNFDGASALISEVAKSGATKNGEIINAIINIENAQEGKASNRIVELAESLAMESRGGKKEGEHWHSFLLTLLSKNNFAKAYAEIINTKVSERDIILKGKNDFSRNLLEKASVVDFLTYMGLLVKDEDFMNLDVGMRLSMSKKMLEYGLYEEAMKISEGVLASEELPEAKIVLASALQSLDRNTEADVVLVGTVGDEARKLQAKIRQSMGDHELAASIFDSFDMVEDASYSYWLEGNWKKLEKMGNTLGNTANQIEELSKNELAALELSLVKQENIVENSVTMRSSITSLIGSTQLSSVPSLPLATDFP